MYENNKKNNKKRSNTMSDENNKNKKRRLGKRPKIILRNSPPIKSLSDLIKIGSDVRLYKNIDGIMLWKLNPYLKQLHNMIGMESLKDSVFCQVLYYIQGLHLRNTENEYLHTMIYGDPGCGKTTVAKIIGKIYSSLGILSKRGKFKIAYRDDFIAGYLGQTSIKTKKMLKSSLGGVLFIDEVYSLAPRDSDRDSFSKEALDTLTAFLSDHKNDFCCIGAGYEREIESCFFSMNKGLKRRFPWVHRIDKYNSREMSLIFVKMLNESKWETNVNIKCIEEIIESNKNMFVNTAGDIETFLSKCKIVHAKRVIGLDKKRKFILSKDDLLNSINMVKKYKNIKDDSLLSSSMYM